MTFHESEPVLLDDSFQSLSEFLQRYRQDGLFILEKQYSPEQIEATVHLSLIDLATETPLNMPLVDTYDQETEDNLEREMNPLTNRITLAFIPEMGQLFIIDGFHRLATLQRHGIDIASATIIETTMEDAYDRRIRAQAQHSKLKVGRLTGWIDDAWRVSGPCRDKISAETAFGFADDRSRFSKEKHGVTSEEYAALLEWVDEKMQTWSIGGLSPGYIHDILHYRGVVDPEIIALVRDDESLSQHFLMGLAADLPNKTTHQHKACQLRLLYGTSHKNFRRMCKALSVLSVDELADVDYTTLIQSKSRFEEKVRRRKTDDMFRDDPQIIAEMQRNVVRLMHEMGFTSRELPNSPTEEQRGALMENYRMLLLISEDIQAATQDMRIWAERLGIELEDDEKLRFDTKMPEARSYQPKTIPELLQEQIAGYHGLSPSERQLLFGLATNDQTMANDFPLSRQADVQNALLRLHQSPIWLLCKENAGGFVRTLNERDRRRRSSR